jgi:hypothetical protein
MFFKAARPGTGLPPSTTYTYDPLGNPTVSGTANDWPFQYKGMEKEFTDPAPYYYSGGGQFYSPRCWKPEICRTNKLRDVGRRIASICGVDVTHR